jgi:glycosyltransferase involved in cell wall biosynthesis
LHFLVYDIIPVQNPQWFNSKVPKNFRRWLKTLAIFADSLLCISDVVKKDVAGWLTTQYGFKADVIPINTIPLGADIAASVPSRGVPPNMEQLLEELRGKPSILMVGTLEPRKGHAQVLAAFEQIWQRGRNVNFVIVGKPGWKTDALQQYLIAHPRKHHHLYWLDDVSDEMLEMLYTVSTGVIAASEAEGFGLSLVEALHHNKPVLARDIPVFHAIGGDGVTYFGGGGNNGLAQDIDTWLGRIAKGEVPTVPVRLHTWHDSAHHLLACLGLKAEYSRQHFSERAQDSHSRVQAT